MIDVTWTGNSSNSDFATPGNWDSLVVPGTGHRALIPFDNPSGFMPLSDSGGARSIGALIFSNPDTGLSPAPIILPDLTVLGALDLDDADMTGAAIEAMTLKDVGGPISGAILPNNVFELINFTGTANAPGGGGTGYVKLDAGNGQMTFNSAGMRKALIDNAFVGTLVAEAVTVDLKNSDLNPLVILKFCHGGAFINYSGCPAPRRLKRKKPMVLLGRGLR